MKWPTDFHSFHWGWVTGMLVMAVILTVVRYAL